MDQVSDVSIVNHSCHLLFPFYHRFGNLSRMDNIEGWQDWRIRLSDEFVKRAEESPYYFQPFVRQILFPEWRISDDEEIQPYSTRHLTKMINEQPFNSDFSLQSRSKDGSPDGEAYCGNILWVDAYLFPEQIGILVLSIQLTTENITLHQLADFLRTARMVLPPFMGFNLPQLSLSEPFDEKNISSMQNFVDNLLEPFIDPESLGGKNGNTYTQTLIGKEEGERCYAFSYVQLGSKAPVKGDTGVPGLKKQDIWLFELGTVSPVGGINTPTIEYIRNILAEHRISIWDSWSALALRDTVTFMEWRFNTPLSKNAVWDYLFLYIYCLYQRSALLKLQNNLIKAGTDSHTRQRQSEALLGRMVEFRNRFWFAEVTRKVQGGELYRKFQKGLEIPILYEFVSTEIHDLYTFFCSVSGRERAEQDRRIAEAEADRDRKLNKRISFIATMFGIPSLTVALLGSNIKGFTSIDGVSILLALLCAASSFLLGIFLGYGITRQKFGNKSLKKL